MAERHENTKHLQQYLRRGQESPPGFSIHHHMVWSTLGAAGSLRAGYRSVLYGSPSGQVVPTLLQFGHRLSLMLWFTPQGDVNRHRVHIGLTKWYYAEDKNLSIDTPISFNSQVVSYGHEIIIQPLITLLSRLVH